MRATNRQLSQKESNFSVQNVITSSIKPQKEDDMRIGLLETGFTKGMRSHRLLGLFLSAFFLYGCTGGLSCGGAGGGCANDYDYPQSEISNGVVEVDDGARLRMTQSALDFLSDNMADILLAQFGAADPNNPDLIAIDLGTFSITDGSIDINIGEGDVETYPTRLLMSATDMAERLTFEFVEGAEEGIRVRMEDIPLGLDARLYTLVNVLGLFDATAGCNIESTNPEYGAGIITGLTIDMLIKLDVGSGAQCDSGVGECLLIDVQVNELDLDPRNSLGASSLDISSAPRCNVANPPANCSAECSDIVLLFDSDGDRECQFFCPVYDFAGDIVLSLLSAIEGLLAPFMDNFLEAAFRNALADFDGSPLSLSSKIGFADLAPGLVAPTTHDLGFVVEPTGNAFDVNCAAGQSCLESRGMDFILKTGFEAAPTAGNEDTVIPHPCVKPYVGADFAALYGAGEFIAPDVDALTGIYEGEVYHLGMSLARASLNQALFGVYNTGVACVELSSDAIHQMTGGAFPLSAGTIDLLAEGKLRQYTSPSSPALVALIPGEPPILTFGEGTEEEGLISLTWNNVEVAFYVMMYERYTRVFSVSTDLSMALSVFNDPVDSMLKVSIVDGPNIENFEERYNELLPGVQFDSVLESLISLAFDAVLSNGLEFEYDIANGISGALGVPIYIDFRGIETLDVGGSREFLNVYLALSHTLPQPQVAVPMPQLRLAQESGLFTQVARPALPSGKIAYPTGEVHLTGEFGRLEESLEVFVKVDKGMWRGPISVDAQGEFIVQDPKLRFIGQHSIAYRARVKGDYNSLAPQLETLNVWVDPVAPKVDLVVAGDSLIALGEDYGTEEQDLLWSFAVDYGEYGAFTDVSVLPLADFTEARRVSVRAKDLAGNVSRPKTLDLRMRDAQGAGAANVSAGTSLKRVADLEPMVTGASAEDVGGCSQSSRASPVFLLGLFGLLLWRRKR